MVNCFNRNRIRALILALLLASPVVLRADDLKERFLREAPIAWNELLNRRTVFSRVLILEVDQLNENETPKRLQHASRIEYKRDGDRFLFVSDGLQRTADVAKTFGGRYGTVWGINDLYAFELIRQSPGGPWVLKELVVFGKFGDPSRLQRSRKYITHQIKYGLLTIAQMPLPEMIKKPYFKVLGVRRLDEHGDELVEVAFEYRHPPNERVPVVPNPVMFDKGKMVLDPNRFWVITSYEVTGEPSKWCGKWSEVVNSEFHKGAVPALKMRKVRGDIENWVKNNTNEQFESIELSQAPPQQAFTLSAFGLPEPPGIDWQPPTRWWLWAMIVGAGALVCAMGFSCRAIAPFWVLWHEWEDVIPAAG